MVSLLESLEESLLLLSNHYSGRKHVAAMVYYQVVMGSLIPFTEAPNAIMDEHPFVLAASQGDIDSLCQEIGLSGVCLRADVLQAEATNSFRGVPRSTAGDWPTQWKCRAAYQRSAPFAASHGNGGVQGLASRTCPTSNQHGRVGFCPRPDSGTHTNLSRRGLVVLDLIHLNVLEWCNIKCGESESNLRLDKSDWELPELVFLLILLIQILKPLVFVLNDSHLLPWAVGGSRLLHCLQGSNTALPSARQPGAQGCS